MELSVEEFDEIVREKKFIEGNNRYYRFEPFDECPNCGEYKYMYAEKVQGGTGFFSKTPTRTLMAMCVNCRREDVFAEEVPRHPDRSY